jgi:hypothetical protein
MDALSRRAIAAAVLVAQRHGVRCDVPEVLADGSNVLVHLAPAPVVARVATTTGLVRKPAQQWLALDLDLAGYLAAQGFPVVPPSKELPPGPHLQDGLALTFWKFIDHDRNYVATAEEVGPFLHELHSVLRGYRGEMRQLSPVTEIPQWLDEVERWGAITGDDMAMLRRGYAGIATSIAALKLPEQPLHGDSHRKNVLRNGRSLLWTDFEDACLGPVAWDVACFIRTSGEDRETALADYGSSFELQQLSPFFDARDLQGALWGTILSTRFEDRRERAAQWMAICRERYG